MKSFALAAMLAVAALLAGSLSAPAQSQRPGAYWYPGGGPTAGGMYRKSKKKKTDQKTHKKSHK
ncbi:MAG TPA: hypothetical protein VL199_18580 [Burkholderiales bacterium]|nr:hypothetical protein [Burkholderiales bacterium]